MMNGAELALTVGITYRQLDYWVRSDVLVPASRPTSSGSGTPRLFDESEVRVARVLAQLRTLGAPLSVLREVGWQLRQFSESDWYKPLYVDTSGAVCRHPSGLCWALDLSLVAA